MTRFVHSWVILFFVSLVLLSGISLANPFRRDIAEEGNLSYQQEDYARAAQEFLKAQDIEPLSAQLRLNLGASYYRQKEYEKASEEFQEATRADDPQTAASAYYNLGNSKYQNAKRDFEAGLVAGATQSASQDAAQKYVKNLEECIVDYQESLKRRPDDQDAKFNIEMIRREIKNLLRRQPQQNQQQQQQQQQNQDEKNKDQQQQEQNEQNKDQQQKDQQQQQQQQQDQQDQQQQDQKDQEKKQEQSEQQKQDSMGTPTPQPMGAAQTQTPSGQENQGKGESQQPTAQPTQMLSISEEMARNLLDNLPETRQRIRPRQRHRAEKDW